MAICALDNVSKDYGSGPTRVQALKRVSLTIAPRQSTLSQAHLTRNTLVRPSVWAVGPFLSCSE